MKSTDTEKGGDWQLSKTCVQQRFKQLLNLSRWTDCTFQVGHHHPQVIHAHKLVLAVSSPVFEALFYGSMASSPGEVISIPDIEPATFRTFLKYLYSDEVNLGNIEEAGELLYVAKKYLVQPLSLQCVNYLISHTWVKTLWDVLAIAEGLNEEKLITACIKVMSRYHYEIWMSENENLSATTMQKLLEKEEMNISELELWEIVLDWARKEVESRGLDDSPSARRAVIDSAGLLSRLRLLVIPPDHLHRLQPLLSQDEVDALKTQTNIPLGFSKETAKRVQPIPVVWKCNREIFRNRDHMWVNRGEVFCQITSTERVLVLGFEVLTREAQITPFLNTPGNCSYREKLVIFIKNSKGNVIQKNDYESTVAFNASQNIHLVRPLWFEANVKYTVNIGFIVGQYPNCKYNNGSCRGTKFFFDEVVLLDGSHEVPSSFITSVMYDL